MSFNVKVIQHFVWKIIRFSGSCSYKFVRRYPVVAGFFIFVLFVYVCFPSYFYILMSSSPILICTAISIRFYWKTKRPEVQMVQKKDSEERSSADINRSKVPSLRPQKSVRRNARKEVLQWDRNDSPDSNLLFGSGINDILSGKSNLLEENSRSLNVKGNSNVEHGESSSQNEKRNDQALNDPKSLLDNETLKPHSVSGDSFGGQLGKSPDGGGGGGGGGGGEVEKERLEKRKDVKEIKVRDRDKAVEWTKDDEKHLMDLGLTEAERNRRLESLIAKRRARKMFKMAIEKSLMDKGIVPHNHIAPILIVKNNILGFSNHANEEVLQMPGSAPSILLPTQNPFDLPYDPFEEKPNLTGDSFQQEFMAVNQRDTLFCRHESFHHGPLFTFETTQDSINDPFNPYYSAEKRLVRGPEVDRFRKAPDDEGGHHQNNSRGFGSDIDLIELEESINNDTINSLEEKSEKITESANDKTEIGETNENPHDLSGSEIRVEIDSTKNNDSCYSASSSDDSESGLDQTAKPLSLCTNQVRKAFNLSIPPKGKTVTKLPFDSSPSPRRTEFNLFYNTYRRQSHTRNCSIASDLQVEVSEVGSITLSTDGTSSPVEGSVTYDGDVERDINSDNEELWGGSFNLSKEANREKLRELDDIIEEDSVEVKVSGLNKKPEEPIASISPSELEKASNVSDKLSPENPGKPVQLTGKSVVHSPSKSCFQKPEQFIDPQQKPTEENIICNAKPITQGDANTLVSKSSETKANGAQALNEPAALGEMGKPDDAINLDSSGYKHGNKETSYEYKRTAESEKKMEESRPSKYIEEGTCKATKHGTGDAPSSVQSKDQPSKHFEEDAQNLTEYNTRNAPNAVQSIDELESIPASGVNQNILEDNVSGMEQRLGGSIAVAPNRRLELEQTYLSSGASPRSVLPQNILADQIPVSDIEQRRQTDWPGSVTEDIVRENSADNQPHENSTFNMPQSTQRLAENSIQDSSSNCGPATSEEPSCVTKKRTDGSTAHNMNELVFEGTQGNDGSSLKSSKDESKTSTSSEDTEELSKTSGESNLDSIEHPGGSEKLIEHNTRTDSSKPKEGNAKTDDPKTMVREKSAAEVDRVCNVKDSLTNKVTNIESLNPVLDGEGEHQILSRQKAVVEPSKTCGATSAGSDKDSKHESTTLTKSEANAGLSTSKGESNSSNNIKTGGDTQNLSGQERLSDASQSREDDLNKAISESISGVDNTATTGISIDHKIATEASKPKEPEVKAVNTKENDSNEVAK
ncbi:hypothetical protein E1A91_A05G095500v1 [Gossypium mustelinum]|uniref:Cardiomyopathy-associated protein 5 n=1 Tax=Gossypium mustelinum TaxID=34275 RepID=A0A5D2Z528_GOSMU|nr:hypothetical protein E1A91_A05G095500v1 [Gossypium mustelinum]